MKKLIVISLIALSCSEDESITYNVAPELAAYVDSFFSEAQDRGVNLNRENLIASLDSNCQSMAESGYNKDQRYFKFDKEIFETMVAQGNPNNKIESFLFHELGRIVLKRELLPNANSIMNPDIKVNGFSAANRNALLDELFK